jgi:hypothetical protein
MKRKQDDFLEPDTKRVRTDENTNENGVQVLTKEQVEHYLLLKMEILEHATSMLDKMVFKAEKFFMSPTFGLDNPEKLKIQDEAETTDAKMDEEEDGSTKITYEFPKDTFEDTEDVGDEVFNNEPTRDDLLRLFYLLPSLEEDAQEINSVAEEYIDGITLHERAEDDEEDILSEDDEDEPGRNEPLFLSLIELLILADTSQDENDIPKEQRVEIEQVQHALLLRLLETMTQELEHAYETLDKRDFLLMARIIPRTVMDTLYWNESYDICEPSQEEEDIEDECDSSEYEEDEEAQEKTNNLNNDNTLCASYSDDEKEDTAPIDNNFIHGRLATPQEMNIIPFTTTNPKVEDSNWMVKESFYQSIVMMLRTAGVLFFQPKSSNSIFVEGTIQLRFFVRRILEQILMDKQDQVGEERHTITVENVLDALQKQDKVLYLGHERSNKFKRRKIDFVTTSMPVPALKSISLLKLVAHSLKPGHVEFKCGSYLLCIPEFVIKKRCPSLYNEHGEFEIKGVPLENGTYSQEPTHMIYMAQSLFSKQKPIPGIVLPIHIAQEDFCEKDNYGTLSFYNDKETSDVTISTVNTVICAHKAILAEASSYFATLFDQDENSNYYSLRDLTTSGVVLETIIMSLYGKNIDSPLSKDDSFELARVAFTINAQNINELSVYAVSRVINVECAIEALKVAIAFESQALFEIVDLFVSANYDEIFDSDQYDDIINKEEKEYFCVRSTPITTENVVSKLVFFRNLKLGGLFASHVGKWFTECIHFIARNMRQVRSTSDNWDQISQTEMQFITSIVEKREYNQDTEDDEEAPWAFTHSDQCGGDDDYHECDNVGFLRNNGTCRYCHSNCPAHYDELFMECLCLWDCKYCGEKNIPGCDREHLCDELEADIKKTKTKVDLW